MITDKSGLMHHSILTHWKAKTVDAMMVFLQELEAGVTFSVAYGGSRDEFERIEFQNKFFLREPALRGPVELQNYACWLKAVSESIEKSQAPCDAVYFTETDHLMLRRGYSRQLVECLKTAGVDFLGKYCMDRNNTNDHFYLLYRDNETLLAHLAGISLRDNKRRIWGALADGMLFRTEALHKLCSVNLDIPCFTEILIPSSLYHLGYKLGDFDSHSDMYQFVRHRPTFSPAEIKEMVKAGASFCHPFKDVETIESVFDFIRKQS